VASFQVSGALIAFALREVATNFFSALYLSFRRPFKKGQRVILHNANTPFEGTVVGMDDRYVTTSQDDNSLVFIPCAKVLEGPLVIKNEKKQLSAAATSTMKGPWWA